MLRAPLKRNRGLTVAELLISALVFGLLTMLIFAFFKMALAAWAKTDGENTVLSTARMVGQRIVAQVQESSVEGLTVDASGIALGLLSARDEGGQVQRDADLALLWQEYRVYWWDRTTARMMVRELAQSPSPEPLPMTAADLGSGPQPLAFYCSGGRIVARNIALTQFELGGQVLKVKLMTAVKKPGENQFETVELEFSARPRNN